MSASRQLACGPPSSSLIVCTALAQSPSAVTQRLIDNLPWRLSRRYLLQGPPPLLGAVDCIVGCDLLGAGRRAAARTAPPGEPRPGGSLRISKPEDILQGMPLANSMNLPGSSSYTTR